MEENDSTPITTTGAAHLPTSNGSLASASLKTPASAPVGRVPSKSNLRAIPSGRSSGHRSYESDFDCEQRNMQCESRPNAAGKPDRSDAGSSSRGRSSGPRRRETMKTLQRELERRSLLRPRPSARVGPLDVRTGDESEDEKNPFKTLTDILFQTAVLGIDTTAKLTKPTLSHIVFPLFRDLWTEYAPLRLQTWVKILPPSVANVGNLLWDTPSGLKLGRDLNELKDDLVDVVSSDVSRQCWIDFTVGSIKFAEALHTPEVKEALDQAAVSWCRFVDVWSSGKAKQVWFDLSSALWSCVEVGSDPLVVMTLAEVCAQVCFALEEERAGLKARRDRQRAAERRRERDERQMEMYPPAGEVVRGREGVERALVQTLTRKLREADGDRRDDGPPSVIVQNNQMGDTGEIESAALDPIDSTEQDGESEITTEEIEDLRLQEEAKGDGDWMALEPTGQQLAYEQGDNESCPDLASETNHHENDAPEMYDVFQESILQFHRRLNEVLEDSRNESKLRDVIEHKLSMKEKRPKTGEAANANAERNVTEARDKTLLFTNFIQILHTHRRKIFIAVAICGMATILMIWFLLGCYGFYVIFLGGGKSFHANPHLTAPTSHLDAIRQSPVTIQVMVGQHQASDEHDDTKTGRFASITLEEWKQMTNDVETAIGDGIGEVLDEL